MADALAGMLDPAPVRCGYRQCTIPQTRNRATVAGTESDTPGLLPRRRAIEFLARNMARLYPDRGDE